MKFTCGGFDQRPSAVVSSFLRILPVFPIPVVALVFASTTRELWAKEQAVIPFSSAKLRIELNTTDNDVGVQVLLDGEPWRWLRIEGPDGRKLLDIKSSRSLTRQGLTELFFESSEPLLDEVPLAEFLGRFAEGEYEFEGKTIDGKDIRGKPTFTHVIPAGPVIVSPQEGASVDPNSLIIEWEPVTKTIAGSSEIVITGYRVIVEQVKPLRMLSIDFPASVTSVKIPREFFVQHNTMHKFEILAIEAGGNRTITERSFMPQ